MWIKNWYPKWVMINGTKGSNLRSISWWFKTLTHITGGKKTKKTAQKDEGFTYASPKRGKRGFGGVFFLDLGLPHRIPLVSSAKRGRHIFGGDFPPGRRPPSAARLVTSCRRRPARARAEGRSCSAQRHAACLGSSSGVESDSSLFNQTPPPRALFWFSIRN